MRFKKAGKSSFVTIDMRKVINKRGQEEIRLHVIPKAWTHGKKYPRKNQ